MLAKSKSPSVLLAHMPAEPDAHPSLIYRRALVESLRRDGHLRSPRVEAAMLAVPRETFVPGVPLDEVYRASEAIVTKRIEGMCVSSASAPEVVALMLEQLDARPGQRVLEIGAGSGYNAALLAHIVGESGHVATVDLDEDLVKGAREHLEAAGCGQVEVVQGDGALGLPAPHAYDRIMLTVASGDIAPPWREQLARPHGRLVLPLALRGLQRCVVFTVDSADENCLVAAKPRNCSFIALRGLLGMDSPPLPIDAATAWLLSGDDSARPRLSRERITELLAKPLRAAPTGVSSSLDEVRQGLHLWLVAHAAEVYTLWTADRLPDLFGLTERAGARGTLCLVDAEQRSLALLAWADESARAGELCVIFPQGGEGVAERLHALVQQWRAAGSPMDAEARIRAYPSNLDRPPAKDEAIIDRRWTRFILSWRRA